MTSRRLLAVALGTALVAPIAASGGLAGAAAGPEVFDPADAITYLDSVQLPDGGFELAEFPGYETSDVVLALSAAAQDGSAWDTAAAAAAVRSISRDGNDALDAIDDLVDSPEDPTTIAAGAQAAKVIAIVAGPTGLPATDFDPSNDSTDPVDLVARMNLHRSESGAYDFGAQFNGALFAALAHEVIGEPIPDGLIAQIVDAQRSDGSWNYAGDQDPDTTGEVDTTALALLALSAAGLDTTDATVRAGAAFLAAGQQPTGAWDAFGADDPNSTAMATVALSAIKVDVTDAGWVRAFGGTPVAGYVGPYAWLAAQQRDDGRVASPNDEYGVNTFATSQTLQAVSQQWHLRQERALLLEELADRLAGDGDAPFPVATSGLGPNPSIRSAREGAAMTIAMSQAGRETAAEALFQRSFGRSLDAGGRAYWSAELQRDARSRILARLTGSAEFYERSGGTTESFVENAYEVVLGRGPDTAGREFWVSRIDGGAAVESVALDLVSSREYRAKEVDVAYQQMLGRNADAGGRDFWTERLATTRVEAILAGIGGSAEFYRRHA